MVFLDGIHFKVKIFVQPIKVSVKIVLNYFIKILVRRLFCAKQSSKKSTKKSTFQVFFSFSYCKFCPEFEYASNLILNKVSCVFYEN
jgi:hypothetical protein